MNRTLKINGDKISVLMARQDLNVSKLANKIGVSRFRCSQILKSSNMTPQTAGRLAKALECDVSEIIISDQI